MAWHGMALGIGGMALSVWEMFMCRKGSYGGKPGRQKGDPVEPSHLGHDNRGTTSLLTHRKISLWMGSVD